MRILVNNIILTRKDLPTYDMKHQFISDKLYSILCNNYKNVKLVEDLLGSIFYFTKNYEQDSDDWYITDEFNKIIWNVFK